MSFVLLFFLLHFDGGVPVVPAPAPAAKPVPRTEDPEVVKNLELLELMDETIDFDLLQELSVDR